MKSTQTTRDFKSRLRWWFQISKTQDTILEPNNVCLATKESIPVGCVPPLLYGGDTLLSGRNTGPEIPYPPKEHGTRDTLPPKEHGTRDTLLPRRNMRPEVPHPPRRNMGPKIPYPLPYPPPVDRMIYFCENITFPQLRLQAVIMVLIFVFFPKCSHFQS